MERSAASLYVPLVNWKTSGFRVHSWGTALARKSCKNLGLHRVSSNGRISSAAKWWCKISVQHSDRILNDRYRELRKLIQPFLYMWLRALSEKRALLKETPERILNLFASIKSYDIVAMIKDPQMDVWAFNTDILISCLHKRYGRHRIVQNSLFDTHV